MDREDNWKPIGEVTADIVNTIIEVRTRHYVKDAARCQRMMRRSRDPKWTEWFVEATAKIDDITIDTKIRAAKVIEQQMRQRAQG